MAGTSSSGGRRTPTATLKLRGSWRGRGREDELRAAPGEPGCPTWLDREARAEWRRVTKALPDRVLTKVDRAALAAYCAVWGDVVAGYAEIKERGRVIKTENGLIANPILARLNDSLRLLKAWAVEFGFTPSSRSNVRQPEPAPKTGKGRFFGAS